MRKPEISLNGTKKPILVFTFHVETVKITLNASIFSVAPGAYCAHLSLFDSSDELRTGPLNSVDTKWVTNPSSQIFPNMFSFILGSSFHANVCSSVYLISLGFQI